jgi:hypothetical protein
MYVVVEHVRPTLGEKPELMQLRADFGHRRAGVAEPIALGGHRFGAVPLASVIVRRSYPFGSNPGQAVKASRSRSRAALGFAPMICLTTLPPSKTFNAGMEVIR